MSENTMLFWWLVASCLAWNGGGARELDPAACAARFDVQRDKIIRTEESRDMGARYLSELDVGTRHECRTLCCETDSCDVFVYEEKSPGSCYLFNCGPPEDFRCKFTAHSNFSSGVLALSRRLAELQDQERLAMMPAPAPTIRVASTSTTTTTPATTPSPELPPRHRPPLPSNPPQPPVRRCSRYQFECHTSGECIAVYNACDGIPQCTDGSDEAPELGCPAASVPIAPAAAVVPASSVQQRPPPQPASQPMPTLPPPHHQTLQESSEISASSEVESRGNSAGNPGIVSVVGNNGEHWPHRLTQAQPQHRDRYTESSNLAAQGVGPHIFSHKGGLLQEPDTMQYAPFEPPAQQQPWPRRVWTQNRGGMESMEGIPGGWGAGVGPDPYQRQDWADSQPRRSWPVPQPRPDPDMSMYMPAKTMPEMPIMYSSQQQTLRDAPKKGVGLETGAAPAPPPPRELPPSRELPPPAPERKEKKIEVESTTKKVVESPAPPHVETSEAASSPAVASGVVMAHSAHESPTPDDHDGLSEHPTSAVFLLVLGVAMTSVMGGMVACRARAARRRLRRGKSSFAHDADYLVNGMYL